MTTPRYLTIEIEGAVTIVTLAHEVVRGWLEQTDKALP